jgi:hypothetical protein
VRESNKAISPPRLRIQFHHQIDEDIGEFFRRCVGGARMDLIIFGLQGLGMLAHECLGHGFLVRKEAIERANLRIGSLGDFRHRRRLEPPLLDHGGGCLKQFGDALATDIALRFQGRTISA